MRVKIDYLRSTNWTSLASRYDFGKGFGCGDKTVKVPFVINEKLIIK